MDFRISGFQKNCFTPLTKRTPNIVFEQIMSKELGDIDYTEEEYLNLGANFEETDKSSIKTNTEIFEECFPFYLAIGMSYAEYWEGDCSLARYYRKAYQIKQEEINNNAWLQGMYIYDAVSTALHNALRGKNSKAREYAKQPYNFDNKEKSELEKAKEVEAEQAKAAVWMENFVKINQKRAESR